VVDVYVPSECEDVSVLDSHTPVPLPCRRRLSSLNSKIEIIPITLEERLLLGISCCLLEHNFGYKLTLWCFLLDLDFVPKQVVVTYSVGHVKS
jgi:hypothetical protein